MVYVCEHYFKNGFFFVVNFQNNPTLILFGA